MLILLSTTTIELQKGAFITVRTYGMTESTATYRSVDNISYVGTALRKAIVDNLRTLKNLADLNPQPQESVKITHNALYRIEIPTKRSSHDLSVSDFELSVIVRPPELCLGIKYWPEGRFQNGRQAEQLERPLNLKDMTLDGLVDINNALTMLIERRRRLMMR